MGELRLAHQSLLALLTLRTGLRSLLAHLLTLGPRLGTHLAHLLTLLSLTTGLIAHLTHLLAALALSLAHGIELSESLAGTIHVACAIALIIGAALAVGITFIGTVDDHAAGAIAVATGTAGSHTGVVGIKYHVDFAGAEGRALGDDIVAQLMHLAFVLIGFAFVFDRPKKVSEVFVLVAHIPTFVGEFLIGEINAGKFFFKLFGVEFPGGFDCGGGKYHRVGRKGEGSGQEQRRKESGRAGHGV